MTDEMTPGEIGRTLSAILNRLDRIDAKFDAINTRFDDLTKVYVTRDVYTRDIAEAARQRGDLSERIKNIENAFVANRRLIYGAVASVVAAVIVFFLHVGGVS